MFPTPSPLALDPPLMHPAVMDPLFCGRRGPRPGLRQHDFARGIGRIEGYAAAMRDMEGAERLEQFAEMQKKAKKPAKGERRIIKIVVDDGITTTSGGIKITDDAYEKYLKHKAKHEEYRGLLEEGAKAIEKAKEKNREKEKHGHHYHHHHRHHHRGRSPSISTYTFPSQGSTYYDSSTGSSYHDSEYSKHGHHRDRRHHRQRSEEDFRRQGPIVLQPGMMPPVPHMRPPQTPRPPPMRSPQQMMQDPRGVWDNRARPAPHFDRFDDLHPHFQQGRPTMRDSREAPAGPETMQYWQAMGHRGAGFGEGPNEQDMRFQKRVPGMSWR